MLQKFIKRTETNEVIMSDSALRDIIPSNDIVTTKKPQQKRCSNVCKIIIFIFILGFITIGILLLTLMVAFSGKSFMSFILHSSAANLTPLSNRTYVLVFHQENHTTTSNKQDWRKITIKPTSSNHQAHTLSSIVTTEQETKHISTNTPSIKSHPSSYAIVDEQSTLTTIQTTILNRRSTILPSTTMKNQEYIETSLENRITTADTYTSTFLIQKLRAHQTTTSKKMPLTTDIDLKFSTNENTKSTTQAHRSFEEENIIDDLLFS